MDDHQDIHRYIILSPHSSQAKDRHMASDHTDLKVHFAKLKKHLDGRSLEIRITKPLLFDQDHN